MEAAPPTPPWCQMHTLELLSLFTGMRLAQHARARGGRLRRLWSRRALEGRAALRMLAVTVLAVSPSCRGASPAEPPPPADTVAPPVSLAQRPTQKWTDLAGACGLWESGAAHCWGLTFGPPTQVVMPAGEPNGFASIAANFFHACALNRSGVAYCWGSNAFGQLGDGTTASRDTPVAVQADHAFASIAVGINHTCAVTLGGEAYCWGLGDMGQLGTGNLPFSCFGGHACSPLPLKVSGDHRFVAISAGGWDRSDVRYATGEGHTCGITDTGEAYCWGMNAYAQLGDSTRIQRNTPVRVAGRVRFGPFITAGYAHSCALTVDGRAYCWGFDGAGQLGVDPSRFAANCDLGGIAVSCAEAPVAVTTPMRFRGIWAGHQYTCALSTDDRPYCWGSNMDGELGNGEIRTQPPWGTEVVAPVIGGFKFVRLSTLQMGRTCGLASTGDAYCWGSGYVTPMAMPTPGR